MADVYEIMERVVLALPKIDLRGSEALSDVLKRSVFDGEDVVRHFAFTLEAPESDPFLTAVDACAYQMTLGIEADAERVAKGCSVSEEDALVDSAVLDDGTWEGKVRYIGSMKGDGSWRYTVRRLHDDARDVVRVDVTCSECDDIVGYSPVSRVNEVACHIASERERLGALAIKSADAGDSALGVVWIDGEDAAKALRSSFEDESRAQPIVVIATTAKEAGFLAMENNLCAPLWGFDEAMEALSNDLAGVCQLTAVDLEGDLEPRVCDALGWDLSDLLLRDDQIAVLFPRGAFGDAAPDPAVLDLDYYEVAFALAGLSTALRPAREHRASAHSELAQGLSRLRQERGLTQEDAARALDVSWRRIDSIERGEVEEAGFGVVRRYADLLGGSVKLSLELPTGMVRLA